MLSDYNKELLAAFNATEEDLIQNRRGFASLRQRELVKKSWDRLGKIGIGFAGVISFVFLAWVYELFQHPFSAIYIDDLFVAFVYIIPLFASILFSVAMFQRRDHSAQEPLTTTEGKAFIIQPSMKKIYPTVYIGDGKDEEKRVSIYRIQSRQFFHRLPYKVYRIGTEIVAVEALQEPKTS